jgi:hypothetical protein
MNFDADQNTVSGPEVEQPDPVESSEKRTAGGWIVVRAIIGRNLGIYVISDKVPCA